MDIKTAINELASEVEFGRLNINKAVSALLKDPGNFDLVENIEENNEMIGFCNALISALLSEQYSFLALKKINALNKPIAEVVANFVSKLPTRSVSTADIQNTLIDWFMND